MLSKYGLSPLFFVALLAEGVDRNISVKPEDFRLHYVALLAEGVDRNIVVTDSAAVLPWSPSSRRAWIEIASTKPLLSV